MTFSGEEITELASDNIYLSVVVTSRNDNHGGNLLHRMQIFVDGLIEQCRRRRLNTELILVEWNPPADQPRFAQALNWPVDEGPCKVRIIEVPPEIHRRFRHSEQLPLFQMIAKNVGIRRAKGRFVLATNIDVLFSDELMDFLARNSLKPDRYYRVDRYDAAADVPLGASIDKQLEFCKKHVLRINTKYGIFGPNEKIRNSSDNSDNTDNSFLRGLSFFQWAVLPFAPIFLFLIRLRMQANIAVPALIKNSGPYQKYWYPLREAITYHPLWLRDMESTKAKLPRILRLHTNACGDFTLMSRESWFDLRGYAEFEIFSFHLDSLLCYAAYYHGVREEILEKYMRIYHIEHGSGWTPDAAEKLFNRLDAQGISRLTDGQLEEHIVKMSQSKKTIFNDESWGLAGEELPEVLIGGKIK
jgi:hypothetical protein